MKIKKTSKQVGRGAMGSHKHGVSGKAPKSPKFRHNQKLEAEKNIKKPKPTSCKYDSVNELMRNERKYK